MTTATQRSIEQVCGYPAGHEHEGGRRPFDENGFSKDFGAEVHVSEGVIMRNGGFRVLAGAE